MTRTVVKTNQLYAMLLDDGDDASILQLRTNLSWLEPVRLEKNDRRELVLKLPEPVIDVATGSKQEMLTLAHTMFGCPDDITQWRYHGDYLYSRRLA